MIEIHKVAQLDIGVQNVAQRGLFIEYLAESLVLVGQIVGVAGQRTLFALVLQIGQLKLFGQNFSQVVGIRFQLVAAAFALTGSGSLSFGLPYRLR